MMSAAAIRVSPHEVNRRRTHDTPGSNYLAKVVEGQVVPLHERLAAASILVVDDDEHVLSMIGRLLLRAGFSGVRLTSNPFRALDWISEKLPDLVLLDINMPELDGFGVLAHLRERTGGDAFVPALAMTGSHSPETTRRALHLGAKDLVRKPLDSAELVLRVRNLLEMRFLYLDLEAEKHSLEDRLRKRTGELWRVNIETLQRLAYAATFRDDATGCHTRRVGDLSAQIAEALALDALTVERIRLAASVHDVGKIGIADEILLKPGPLTPSEFETMKQHTLIGARLCADGNSEEMRLAATIARTHHERFDGTGYPNGLSGQDIPLAGRIVAVADFYDALTSERPYRRAWEPERVMAMIREGSGKHFDPEIVDAFCRCMGSGGLDLNGEQDSVPGRRE
jgi:putative two-component system response regulator